MTAVLVIGVGNRWGGDDGVGPAVVDRVRQLCRRTAAIECCGEPARLVEAWDNAELVVLIDAVHSGAPPGTAHRVVLEAGATTGDLGALAERTSSHGSGVADAWGLGTTLGRTPDRLVVLGVEGACFEPGHQLSEAVARAVPGTAAAVEAEIRAATIGAHDVPQ